MKIHSNAWGADLPEKIQWDCYDLAGGLQWPLQVVEKLEDIGIKRLPSRAGWYRFLERMRRHDATRRIEKIAQSVAEAQAVADKHGIKAAVFVETLKTLAIDKAMTGDDKAATSLASAAATIWSNAQREKELELKTAAQATKDAALKLSLPLKEIQTQVEPVVPIFQAEEKEVVSAEPAPTPTETEPPMVNESDQPKIKTPQPHFDISVDFSYFECQVEGMGSYEKGEFCTLTVEVIKPGKAFSCWKEGNKVVSSASSYSFEVAGKRNLVAECVDVPEGAVRGLFSVNEEQDTLVWFAQGNLQYQASTNTWRIAAHQYDCIGSLNDSDGSETDDEQWIDLFGWGTGNNPTFRSVDNEDYGAFVDWGDNTVSLHQDGETHQNSNTWRTLTNDEWFHIINDRQTESGIRYAKAIVDEVNGVILLPDNWNKGSYNLNRPNESNAPYGSNVISQETWNSVFEAKGAVFLPAAGFRISDKQADYVNKTYDVGSSGRYWSSEKVFADSERAKSLQISNTGCSVAGEERSDEISVRLVHRQAVSHNRTGKSYKPQKGAKPRKQP